MKNTTVYYQSLLDFADNKLQILEDKNQRRRLQPSARSLHMQVNNGQNECTSFTDNDYLGLSTHPAVIQASMEATKLYGVGAGASRLVTGNNPLYGQLEEKIANFKGCEAAIVFGSGYLANIGIIPALAGPKDLIIADELIHTCIHSGIALSRATCHYFKHNDVEDAQRLLAKHRANHPNTMIIVDGVYSMDGDIAPLDELGMLARQYDAWLMSDDAHALGTIGNGTGSASALGAHNLVPLQMGTLSKAIGAYGGYLAGPKPVINLMKSRARSLVYTTGLPPGTLAAALKAFEIIEAEPERVARPLKLASQFASALNLNPPQSPIVPLIIGDETAAMKASANLAAQAIKVTAIRPPTVPTGTSRLRFTFSATHSDSDIDKLIRACRNLNLGN
ncbi:8-amino-7-oxononanoate synthase [Kordiimonas sp. SCSIO 12610]|uniref:8-amino-7-oxononanoate synthase n=1 Tax=Kordiimonas sp. SCSIO 12610 TaxID=2829597 RepID=UPI0021FEAD61|nr:8-amino-7-oxononanoate synthase [Kordiimonas sp. SCSIO 12610]